jgi:phage minor structural protein
MILYFADRQLNILGQASTELPKGLTVTGDLKAEEIETGVTTFECYIPFDKKTRNLVESYAEVGNYLLRSHNGENEFYTIIDSEIDTKKQQVYIYAENDGMDLLNEIFGEYEADKAYSIDHYINKFAAGSGFQIGINEAKGLTRKLSWDGEETATARIASVATQFGGCEISFSFDVDGLVVTKKYINIYKQRGKDVSIPLRLNKEIDSIITTKSIANLATALQCEGGTPDEAEKPITLKGYKYDDGDFYVDGTVLKSRTALKQWRRLLWKDDGTTQSGGHIVKLYSYDTTSQQTLCSHAITELKKIRDIEVNYEIDIKELPDNVKIGDRVNIVDDAGELYVSARVLKLTTSVVDQEHTATLGEYLIKSSGISQKVADLAAEFAKNTKSAAKALSVSTAAKAVAENAQAVADEAAAGVSAAQAKADEAKAAAETATESATAAQTAANAAQAAVGAVVESVSSLEKTVTEAENAANNAHLAAETAETKAGEAKAAALQAQADAQAAANAAGNAQTAANSAISKSDEAKNTAEIAKANAANAIATAAAAKLDAEQAEKDIKKFENELATTTKTLKASYARKTDLTEAEEKLQTQISENAAKIESTAYKFKVIDETTNDAADKVEAAQNAAALAQQQANEAATYANAAQTEADTARTAADNAQAEADTAKIAAETARAVADQAEADLKAAKIDLATVEARADATEAEIVAAQQAVNLAQNAADKAIADAEAAQLLAESAQEVANNAVWNAEKAQAEAEKAAEQAELAQQIADQVKGNAQAAQQTANDAIEIANNAQATADAAKAAADSAQATADAAKNAADSAKYDAKNAKSAMEQAATDLATAQTRLDSVRADAEATAEQLAEAEAAVQTALTNATNAETAYTEAQAAANTAESAANEAQAKADNAKTAANEAQLAASEAQTLADIAKGIAAALCKRTVEVESKIVQTADQIEMRVREVSTTLNDNEERITEAESLIKQLADSISMLVTDGNGASLMKQTANGWTFSTTQIQDTVNSTASTLDELIKEFGSVEAAIEALNQAVSNIGLKTEYVNIGTYTYTDKQGAEQTEPCIELGESDSVFKVLITNTQIMFKEGSSLPTRIDTDGLATENITVENEFRQTNEDVKGQWVWAVRANGNYGLLWKGADE